MHENLETYQVNKQSNKSFMYCMECNQVSTQKEIADNENQCPNCNALIFELVPWKQITAQNPNLPKMPKKNTKYNMFL